MSCHEIGVAVPSFLGAEWLEKGLTLFGGDGLLNKKKVVVSYLILWGR